MLKWNQVPILSLQWHIYHQRFLSIFKNLVFSFLIIGWLNGYRLHSWRDLRISILIEDTITELRNFKLFFLLLLYSDTNSFILYLDDVISVSLSLKRIFIALWSWKLFFWDNRRTTRQNIIVIWDSLGCSLAQMFILVLSFFNVYVFFENRLLILIDLV